MTLSRPHQNYLCIFLHKPKHYPPTDSLGLNHNLMSKKQDGILNETAYLEMRHKKVSNYKIVKVHREGLNTLSRGLTIPSEFIKIWGESEYLKVTLDEVSNRVLLEKLELPKS